MSTIAEKLQQIVEFKKSIKDIISLKGVIITDSTPLSDYSKKIIDIPTPDKPDDDNTPTVNFYNLSGDIVYSYTYSQISGMTELPTIPDYIDEVNNTPMSAIEWSHSLGEIKSALSDGYNCDVGPYYQIPDHETRIYVNIPEDNYSITAWFGNNNSSASLTANSYIYDWGDGTETSFNTVQQPHTYASKGKYIIRIKPSSSYMNNPLPLIPYGGELNPCIRHNSAKNENNAICIEKVELGDTITKLWSHAFSTAKNNKLVVFSQSVKELDKCSFRYNQSLRMVVFPRDVECPNISETGDATSYVFEYCSGIKYIVIPEPTEIRAGVNEIGNHAFSHCHNLKRITIPYKNTVIGNNFCEGCTSLISISNQRSTSIEYPITENYNNNQFRDCINLKFVKLGVGMTAIPQAMFYHCVSLENIKIPSTITTIGASSFEQCVQLSSVDLSDLTSVPTLDNVSAFHNVHPNCVFKVASSMVNSFKTTGNWATLFTSNPNYNIEAV